eukprot:865699-Lingulodinium_polyedra.AAC.1
MAQLWHAAVSAGRTRGAPVLRRIMKNWTVPARMQYIPSSRRRPGPAGASAGPREGLRPSTPGTAR